jgi:NADPH-dependent glutamate synthase beta subunit-like oxidoreductase
MAESADIVCGWGPKEIIGDENGVTGVVFRKCLSVFDPDGRFNPTCDDSRTTEVKADFVIAAIGQGLDDAFQKEEEEKIPRRGNVFSASYDGRTDIPYLFAGGDCVTGPDSAVSAVNRGKQAASSIDRYLGGDGQVIDIKKYARDLSKQVDESPCKRELMEILPLCERGACFDEIEEGFTEEQVVREAGRCLRCDVLKVSKL